MIATLICATLSMHDADSGRLCTGERFRLVAVSGPIDSPELPGSPRCRRVDGWCDYALAERARDYARAFVRGGAVVHCQGVDRYQRRLCRVTVDGVDLGDALIVRGFAVVVEGWR